ncbi:hypothetical protein SELMODRAFT_417672 [Selaginella moellendorffii]|uniref:Uncharacterized protein n=1 Tax=Selaginella moellendorffii TaxID=88036 RepID=D8S374_SELML|nr:hypothetical protein SELMODRAFT_417672 [Selaginella moellendorffii]
MDAKMDLLLLSGRVIRILAKDLNIGCGGREDLCCDENRNALKSCKRLDPARNEWEAMADLGQERRGIVMNCSQFAIGKGSASGAVYCFPVTRKIISACLGSERLQQEIVAVVQDQGGECVTSRIVKIPEIYLTCLKLTSDQGSSSDLLTASIFFEIENPGNLKQQLSWISSQSPIGGFAVPEWESTAQRV